MVYLHWVIFWLFLSLQAAVLQHYLFADSGWFSAVFAAFQALLLWGWVLTLRRRWIAVFLVTQFVVAALLLTWHAHFADSLSLEVLRSQFREGWGFAKTARWSLLTWPVGVAAALLAVNFLWLALFFQRPAKNTVLRLIFAVPFAVLVVFAASNFHRRVFTFTDFKLYTRHFGYATAWLYEVSTNYQMQHLFADIVENTAQPTPPLPPELQNLHLPSHVFIIQVESLDYAAFEAPHTMPFMQSLAPTAYVYAIRPKNRHQSANSDFMILSKANHHDKYYFAVYKKLPLSYYAQIDSLPRKAAALGYQSSAYHGFTGSYYNRDEGLERLGFSQRWFNENLPAPIERGEWGVDDQPLFDFALQRDRLQSAQSPRQFHFLITVSSHENYQVSAKTSQPYSHPQTRLEKYYNSVNYVDAALQQLISNAPQDSLFIIYSDHQSGEQPDLRTLLFIYDKSRPQAAAGEINFAQVPLIIHGLFEQAAEN